jgi:hypothetical protein
MHLENLNLFKMVGGGAHLFEPSYLGIDTSSLETLKPTYITWTLEHAWNRKTFQQQQHWWKPCVCTTEPWFPPVVTHTSFSIIGHHTCLLSHVVHMCFFESLESGSFGVVREGTWPRVRTRYSLSHSEPAPTSTPSTGCPLLLSCGWISSTELVFGFTLVTDSIGR